MYHNHKGEFCWVRKLCGAVLLCQEGWCSKCQIYLDRRDGVENNKQTSSAGRNKERKTNS